MVGIETKYLLDIKRYLKNFRLKYQVNETADDTEDTNLKTRVESVRINGREYSKYINEYWTSKQRQASSLHEIAYRACFKAQLPRFFIELLTERNDIVYDPFSGRGTTVVEAALMGRNIISNDVLP